MSATGKPHIYFRDGEWVCREHRENRFLLCGYGWGGSPKGAYLAMIRRWNEWRRKGE